jgi:uncharacterized membrane protein YkvA (DUF1232 family)
VAHIDVFKGWAETIRQDIDAHKALLENEKASADARKLAGAALAYLVSKMDLIPDWNEGIGVIDDVMVLRVCAQLSAGFKREGLASSAEVVLERLASEADKISAFLGGGVYDKLKQYCSRLADQAVRGRTPAQLADDAGQRKALYVELEDEIKKTVPIVINDPADAELRLKSYLTQKLK